MLNFCRLYKRVVHVWRRETACQLHSWSDKIYNDFLELFTTTIEHLYVIVQKENRHV